MSGSMDIVRMILLEAMIPIAVARLLLSLLSPLGAVVSVGIYPIRHRTFASLPLEQEMLLVVEIGLLTGLSLMLCVLSHRVGRLE